MQNEPDMKAAFRPDRTGPETLSRVLAELGWSSKSKQVEMTVSYCEHGETLVSLGRTFTFDKTFILYKTPHDGLSSIES